MFGITNDRKEKTFKVLSVSGEPVSEFISVKEDERNILYKKYADMGITLPDYNLFKTIDDLNIYDVQVLVEDFNIKIEYDTKIYEFTIRKGFCSDGASIPPLLRYDMVSNNSQYSYRASLIHDICYASGILPKKSCDNFFEGILRYDGLSEFWIFIFIAGLAIGGGAKYKELRVKYVDPTKYWGYPFYTLKVTDIGICPN